MLKRSIAGIAVAVLAAHAVASSAEAQLIRGVIGGPRVFVGPGGPVTLTPGYGYSPATVAPATTPATVAPYSYYVLPSTVPSRTYIGPSEFPFYGRPYGHPYDRWTWPYISGGPNADLARYYYPPLGG
ncbi:MAG: hypothetical protein LC745_05055 [Planctomycetia bacterium]|nr:hypothetical protein [Planctomycetia bacterium]